MIVGRVAKALHLAPVHAGVIGTIETTALVAVESGPEHEIVPLAAEAVQFEKSTRNIGKAFAQGMPSIAPVIRIHDASSLVELVVGKAPTGDVVHPAGGNENTGAGGMEL